MPKPKAQGIIRKGKGHDESSDDESEESYRPASKKSGTNSKGRKRKLQTYTIRYAMKVMEKHARDNAGFENMTLKQQQQAKQMKEDILGRVRKRLTTTQVPHEYESLEDPCVDNLALLNQQRQAEIKVQQKMIPKLRHQIDEVNKELRMLKKEQKRHEQQTDIKKMVAATSSQQSTATKEATTSLASYKRAPPGTMALFLEALKKSSA